MAKKEKGVEKSANESLVGKTTVFGQEDNRIQVTIRSIGADNRVRGKLTRFILLGAEIEDIISILKEGFEKALEKKHGSS